MPREVVERFEVEWLQVLDPEGNADESLMPDLSKEDMRKMYEHMVTARAVDECIFRLQREGRAVTYARSLGQEAAQVGATYPLASADWLVPCFRDIGAYLVRGISPALYIQYWVGDERGMRVPEGLNHFLICIPVSTQIPHAVGIGWGLKHRGEKAAVLCFLGDGATSKGDFHEGLNLAGVFQTPTVFVCQNNQWAISVPIARQTASRTLAQKALAYGFEGLKVDGNDVLAVYRATSEALVKARTGGGPTLIECLTYRMADHTTADDATKYRDEEEVALWRGRDPIVRFRKFMTARGIWSDVEEEELAKRAEAVVGAAVRAVESLDPAAPGEIFEYTYADLPWSLKEQRDRLLDEIRRKG